MSAENFTVKGVCFIPVEQTVDMLRNMNKLIIEEMEKRGYFAQETNGYELSMGGRPRMTLTFFSNITPPSEAKSVFDRLFRVDKEHALTREEVHEGLKAMIDAYPLTVTFRFRYHSLQGGPKGIRIEIESEPAIVVKRRSLNEQKEINETYYEDILSKNKKLINDVASAAAATFLEAPTPIQRLEFPKLPPLMGFDFTSKFPDDVKFCLDAADACFSSGHSLSCSILLRKALEVGIYKKFQQEGKTAHLIDKNDDEISLKAKLNIVGEVAPKTKSELGEIKMVKWLSDKAVHDPSVRISPEDIKNSIIVFKSFITDLQLKI
jgi:hypothetical protein